MLFNSYVFILAFLPAILILWWNLGRLPQTRLAFLVVASYLFYGWWRWEFTLLLLLSTVLDYYVGHRIVGSIDRSTKRSWLLVSIAINLGMLGYFKYAGFMAQSFNSIAEFLRCSGPLPVLDIMLPIGISFYTFQSLTYSIDIYRGQIKPAKSFLHFAAYVSMFPQLIAGPIVRFSDVEDQFANLPSRIPWSAMQRGIELFVIGMSQKILLADTIAKLFEPLLLDYHNLQFGSAWVALLGYSCQLYFDFAGYSHMAMGLGWMMGFQFPANFDAPYRAVSIQDFWRRWHMTLSNFLRDYLYVPLGGNRSGSLITYRNLMIVMILGGLWHGAGLLFLLWGAYHGTLLVLHSLYRASIAWPIPKWLSMAVTFVCVILGWVLFRSHSLEMAGSWYQSLLGLRGLETSIKAVGLATSGSIALLAGLAICWLGPTSQNLRLRPSIGSALVLSGILLVCIMRFDAESPFLYFQF